MNKQAEVVAPGTRLLILDSHGIMFRSYFAMPEELTDSAGKPTGAVLGFANTLSAVLTELAPTHIIAAWDASEETFRKQLDPNYKANRDPTPVALRSQFDTVRDMLAAQSIPLVECPGYEADDVMGTLARQASELGINETILLTLDNDLIQLVDEQVRVYMYRPYQKDYVMYDEAKVFERFGFKPIQMIDYKGLVGDTSDNIPGVKGIGDKGAKALIASWGDIDRMIDNLDAIEPTRTRSALEKGQASALSSRELATIVRDVPDLVLDLGAADRKHFDPGQARSFFEEIGFKTHAKRVSSSDTVVLTETGSARTDLTIVQTDSDDMLQVELQRFSDLNKVAVTVVSDSHLPVEFSSHAIGIAIVNQNREGLYFPIRQGDTFSNDQELPGFNSPSDLTPAIYYPDLETVLEWLQKQIERGMTLLVHDAKQTVWCLRKLASEHNIVLGPVDVFDTKIGSYLLGFSDESIQDLATRLVLDVLPDEKTLLGSGKSKKAYSELETDVVAEFTIRSGALLFEAEQELTTSLEERQLGAIFREIDVPHTQALARMEDFGIKIDSEKLYSLGFDLESELDDIEKAAFQSVGQEVNMGSPAELSRLLFDELSLPPSKKIKTGFSTDAESLSLLVDQHPVVRMILDWREISKLKSTYVDALPRHVNHTTGRIHTIYSQTTTATGRLSSTAPNLQNLPIRGDRGGMIRDAFIASDCGVDPLFLSIDYSQIELRILAHLSQDEALIEAFLGGLDIHTSTAANIFGKSNEDVSYEERRRAKVFNFGVLYGLSAFGLSVREGITREEAQDFIDSYFRSYPKVEIWRDQVVEEARSAGYAQTMTGRRRAIPELHSRNQNVRRAGERIAMNMPVQGTASDIIKIATNNIDEELMKRREMGLHARLVMQIHDELIFELPSDEVASIIDLAEEMMPSIQLSVPLLLDKAIGTSLGNLEEI